MFVSDAYIVVLAVNERIEEKKKKKKKSETKSKYGVFKAHSHSELNFCFENNNPPLISLFVRHSLFVFFSFLLHVNRLAMLLQSNY